MKEFFSKTLNWVTLSCLVVWMVLLGLAVAFPDILLEKVFNLSDDMIHIVIGSLIGAGGVKVSQVLKQAAKPEEYGVGESEEYGVEEKVIRGFVADQEGEYLD